MVPLMTCSRPGHRRDHLARRCVVLGIVTVILVGLSSCSIHGDKPVSLSTPSASARSHRPWSYFGCSTLLPAFMRDQLVMNSKVVSDGKLEELEQALCTVEGPLVSIPSRSAQLSMTGSRPLHADTDEDAKRAAVACNAKGTAKRYRPEESGRFTFGAFCVRVEMKSPTIHVDLV